MFLTDVCNKDPCDGVICIHGSCKNGNCVCSASYTGKKCDVAKGCDKDYCKYVDIIR